MSRLVKGLWCEFRKNIGGQLFGLSRDQMRAGDYVHNARWYNIAGEFIGYGDLSFADMTRIARELTPDEVFVVLREDDAYPHRLACLGALEKGASLAGVLVRGIPYDDYVAAKCSYVIVAGMAFAVEEADDVRANMRTHRSGLMMVDVSRTFVVEIFNEARKLAA